MVVVPAVTAMALEVPIVTQDTDFVGGGLDVLRV